MPNFFSKLFGKGRSSPPMAARCDTCAKLEDEEIRVARRDWTKWT